MTLPKTYTIPTDRFPKPWSQSVYDCCVAASITKVLEVINFVKTGQYTMFSKGYVYGRHNRAGKKQGGMDYNYTIPRLLERGTVPEEMCPIMDEIPSIREKLNKLPNIIELDKEAEKTKLKGFTKIIGNARFDNHVKTRLYETNMPLVGNMVGKRHCAVIVGWDEYGFLYLDHNGRDNLKRGDFNEAYYLDGGINMEFKDVSTSDWFYQYVKNVYDKGIMTGTSDDTFEPNRPVTRAELATVISRLLEK
jgi:hypothetical protein